MQSDNAVELATKANPASGPVKCRRRLVIALAVLVLCITLMEVGLRLFFGLGNPIVYQLDRDCGYLPLANQHTQRFGKLNQINAFGQRSADLPAVKPPGHYRVLFIGDSYTYGTTYVDQADLFATRVARELPPYQGKPVEVMSAAAGGWAVGNELGYLKSRGTFGADVVIFVLNTGDLNAPFNRIELTPTNGYPSQRPATAFGELWIRYVSPRLFGMLAPADAGSTAANGGQSPEAVLDELDQARLFVQANIARFAVVYIPAYGASWETPLYRDALAELEKWCSAKGVPLLNLTQIYATDTPDHVYFDGGTGHPRPLGHQLAADAIERNWSVLASARNPTSQP